jgi:hypothetical protein
MNRLVKIVFYFLAFDLLLLFALDWIVWGEYVPQASSLGLLGYVGIIVALSACAHLLEYIPELLGIWR